LSKREPLLTMDEILRRMPKRKIKRTTVDLPEDQIKVVDACAKALGVSRSNFLLLWVDCSVKAMIEWTQNLLNRSQVQVNFTAEPKPETKK